jgi:hypothetical protein
MWPRLGLPFSATSGTLMSLVRFGLAAPLINAPGAASVSLFGFEDRKGHQPPLPSHLRSVHLAESYPGLTS